MSPTEYPRPSPVAAERYGKDTGFGVYIVASSLIGLVSHVPHALGLGQRGTNVHPQGAVLLSGLLVLRLLGGSGVYQSLRWGFLVAIVASLLYLFPIVLALIHHPSVSLLVMAFFSAWTVYYCAMRLAGREGSRPG